jgi:Rrf2 family protein
MKFTTRSRYGTQILLEVALHEENGPVSLRDIAARLDVSVKYLEKLSKILKKAGYLESIVGSRGGYRLKVHPTAIRMGDVTFLLETGEYAATSSPHGETDCPRVDTCAIRSIWTNAIQAMRDTLNAVSLEDMMGDACFCPGKPCHASSTYGFLCSKPKKDEFPRS